MKKNFIRSVAFLGILLGILVGISEAINYEFSKDNDLVGDRSRNVIELSKEEAGSLDVLILGDSESYTSISPMHFYCQAGITGFVGGQAGQQTCEAQTVLKDCLKKQKPKVVLLETNMFFRKNDAGEKLFNEAYEAQGHFLSVFKHHDIWKRIIHKEELADSISYKGFKIKSGVVPYNGVEYMKPTGKVKKIPKDCEKCITEIVEMCRKNDVAVVFYSSPSPVNYNYKTHNAIQKLADKLDAKYIDLNLALDKMDIDWSKDTVDKGDHLNIAGACKASDYVLGKLKKIYDFTDHRGDSAYAAWDALAKEYDRDVDEALVHINGSSASAD